MYVCGIYVVWAHEAVRRKHRTEDVGNCSRLDHQGLPSTEALWGLDGGLGWFQEASIKIWNAKPKFSPE